MISALHAELIVLMIIDVGTYLVAHERITFLNHLLKLMITVKDVANCALLNLGILGNVSANS